MRCLTCDHEFTDADAPRAAIAIFVMGDEYIYSYRSCSRCGQYTVESYHDRFMGDDDISFFPLAKADGDRAIELIAACPDPQNKHCDCDSHKALYYGRP